MSKQDKLYKDAVITAAVSGSSEAEVAEERLSYFVDIGNKECFAAMPCYTFVSVCCTSEEPSWQHGLNDFFMPFGIQLQRSTIERVSGDHT